MDSLLFSNTWGLFENISINSSPICSKTIQQEYVGEFECFQFVVFVNIS